MDFLSFFFFVHIISSCEENEEKKDSSSSETILKDQNEDRDWKLQNFFVKNIEQSIKILWKKTQFVEVRQNI